MSRKPQGRAQTPAPQTAQVDAVERLLEQQRYHEAAAKAERLAQQFPTHVRLRDLRIRAVASAGEIARAALLAEAWTREQPNSQRGWALLFGLSADLGLGFLAHACHLRLDALGATDAGRAQDAKTLIESIRDKFAGLSDEEGQRSDRGLLFLIGERLEEAVAELGTCTHPVPRTNLAAAHFDLGDMEQAIAVAREAWAADSYNTHAARILARALLYAGDGEGAAAAGAKLRDVLAREPDELAAQLETFALLEDYGSARRCYESFPGTGFDGFRRDVLARMHHAAAVAYFNLDQRDRARVLWQQALDENREHPLYQACLMRVLKDDDDDEPAWRELVSEAFPSRLATDLLQRVEAAGGSEAVVEDPALLVYPLQGHAFYLGALLRQCGPLCRTLARENLADRAGRGDAAAEAELRRFIEFRYGKDTERVEALRALYYAGRLPPSGPVTVFLRGALRTLEVTVPAASENLPLPGMPADAQDDYIRSVYAHKPAQAQAALEKLRHWRTQAPTEVLRRVLDHRIALLLQGPLGRAAEGETLLKQSIDSGEAPARSHAFAARVAMARGDLGAASRLLEGQLARAGSCDEDLAPVLVAQEELHAARGETDLALAAMIARECLGAFDIAEA